MNRYMYVSNRITVFTDPFGLQQAQPQNPPQESTVGWLWRVYVKELLSGYGPDTASDAAAAETASAKGLGALGDLLTSSTTFLDYFRIQTKHNQDLDFAEKCVTDPSCGTSPTPPPVLPPTPPKPPNECKR
jgi:hypothetical protein